MDMERRMPLLPPSSPLSPAAMSGAAGAASDMSQPRWKLELGEGPWRLPPMRTASFHTIIDSDCRQAGRTGERFWWRQVSGLGKGSFTALSHRHRL